MTAIISEEAVKAAVDAVDEGVNWVAGLFGEKYDNAEEVMRSALTAALPFLPVQGAVKKLEWVDADEGMCTKWRAAALGGHYELVDFGKNDPGFAVNFHWGRPLSFWFIQGDPDECGPTGPKIFPTLDAAKAAAQADLEARILSALEPSAGRAAVLEEALHNLINELSGNPGELIDKMAGAIRDWGSHYDDGPWETLPEDRKAGWRGDAERALAAVKEYLTARRPSEQAVTEAMVEAVQRIRNTAMRQSIVARIPECGEFGGIAQDADWLLDTLKAAREAGR